MNDVSGNRDHGTSSAPNLSQIADRLRCPQCAGPVEIGPDRVVCSGCRAQFPVRDGVPLLARLGTAENWDRDSETGEDSSQYQQSYQEIANAAKYNEMYKGKISKRWSTAREFRILRRLLSSREHSGLLLDLPCGGGRLSPQIAPFTDLLVEADIAEGQVLYGKRTMRSETPQLWMTASAFHIPFKDASFDGVVCCRLCHHLPTAVERERLITELLRVSKGFVVMTFFDHHSIKNTLRRLRRPLDHKPPKMTMTIARVRQLARENGANLVEYPMISPTSSGHRYALMVKEP